MLTITSGKEGYEMSVALANIIKAEKLAEVTMLIKFEYAILQSIPHIYIGTFDALKKELGGEINPRNYNSGRLFSEDLEIRWRRKGEDAFP